MYFTKYQYAEYIKITFNLTIKTETNPYFKMGKIFKCEIIHQYM